MNNFYKYFNEKIKKQKEEKLQQLEIEIEPPTNKIEDKKDNDESKIVIIDLF